MEPATVRADAPAEVKERAVAQRSMAYWTALKTGDYATAYGFLSAGSRDALPLDRFRSLFQSTRITYRDVKVQKVQCEDVACRATLSITYDHPMVKGVVTPGEEHWIFEGGQPWLVRQ